MPPFTAGDIIAVVSCIALCLSNYYGMKAELKILRAEILPVIRWWNRMAENQASRLFVGERHRDRTADVTQGE